MDEDEAYPTGRIKLYPCDICGRNFNQDSLNKHRNACKKLTKAKRKVFDSGRQRADGSDVIYSKTKETKRVQIEGERVDDTPKSNWREQHNQFLRTVRQARNVSEAIKTGAPIPKFEPSAVPSDYVNCQFCGRNFSRNAAERHIPFCETQSKRQKINNSANQKSNLAKNKYQAPMPGQRKQSSEAYGYQNETSSYSAQARPPPNQGYANKGYASGGAANGTERRPVRYDSNLYYDDGGQETYAKNKPAITNKNRQQDQLLRTGRNTLNSELNALARNRSGGNSGQKESPMNSRDPSQNRRQVAAQQNGTKNTYAKPQPAADTSSSGSRYCHECGYEFPVQWARFCSYCGDKRL